MNAMALGPLRFRQAGVLAAGILAAAAAYVAPMAGAHHGDLHARCNGDTPVITSRPPGTEHVQVVCRDGIPEFMVVQAQVPTYNPITQGIPRATPPDFGGWVTVWLNGHPLHTPYDPVRGIQEPGAYLSASTGRVMMPVRFFTEAFGGDVKWSNQQRRAQLSMWGRSSIYLWLEKRQGMVNGRTEDLDQPPVLFQDRMFVPVRFLVEGFGATVEWDHANRSVRVEMPGARCSNRTYCGEVR